MSSTKQLKRRRRPARHDRGKASAIAGSSSGAGGKHQPARKGQGETMLRDIAPEGQFHASAPAGTKKRRATTPKAVEAPRNLNLDDLGHLIRVGAIVCVDGPMYGIVEQVHDGAVILRPFDPDKGAVPIRECQGWQATEVTVVCEPLLSRTELSPIEQMRARAHRSGQYAGCDKPEYSYTADDTPNAEMTVYRVVNGVRHAFYGQALWHEFATDPLDARWEKQPHVCIAECAELDALRRAFPE